MKSLSCSWALAVAIVAGAWEPVSAAPNHANDAPVLSVSPAPLLTRDDLEPWLDGYFDRALAEAHLAGAVIVVVRGGQVVLAKGYGVADMAHHRPIDPERTLFRAGSISKLFVGTAVMQLVEQGKLDLDRDVNTYLDFTIPPAFSAPVTLRNLLTHTAGFADVLKNLIVTDPARSESLEQYVKRHVPRRVYPPGSTPAYSNYGLALAGYIVERASGERFDDYIARHIFGPLGMTHSTFHQPVPAGLEADLSLGYLDPAAPPRPFSIYGPAPAGALSTTGADIARFMMAHLADGVLDGNRILSVAAARVMREPATDSALLGNGMGLTFLRYDRNGRRIVGHDGGDPVFRSNLRLLPDDSVGIFVSFNTIGPTEGVFAVRSVLLDAFLDRYFPTAPPPVEPTTPTAREHAQLAEGWYAPSDMKSSFFRILGVLDQTRVTANPDGTIVLSSQHALDGRLKSWREVEPFVWREVGGFDRLTMAVGNGRVTRIVNSSDVTGALLRVEPFRSAGYVLPLFAGVVVILVIAVIGWPIAALVRRRYGVRLDSGRRRAVRRFALAAAVLDLVFLLGWTILFQQLGDGRAELFSGSLDPFLRVLQVVGLAGALGSVAALWSAVLVWRNDPRWSTRMSSIVLAAGQAGFVWVGLVSGLLSQSLRY